MPDFDEMLTGMHQRDIKLMICLLPTTVGKELLINNYVVDPAEDISVLTLRPF